MDHFHQLHLRVAVLSLGCQYEPAVGINQTITLCDISRLFALSSPMAFAYIKRIQQLCVSVDGEDIDTAIIAITNAFSCDREVFEALDIQQFIRQLLPQNCLPDSIAFFCCQYIKFGQINDNFIALLKMAISSHINPSYLAFQKISNINFTADTVQTLQSIDVINDLDVFQFLCNCTMDSDGFEEKSIQLINRYLQQSQQFLHYFEENFHWELCSFQAIEMLLFQNMLNNNIVYSFFQQIDCVIDYASSTELCSFLRLIQEVLNGISADIYFQVINNVEGVLNYKECDNEDVQELVFAFRQEFNIDLCA